MKVKKVVVVTVMVIILVALIQGISSQKKKADGNLSLSNKQKKDG